MNKMFQINESEKNRILGLHENATKKQYLLNNNDVVSEQIYTAQPDALRVAPTNFNPATFNLTTPVSNETPINFNTGLMGGGFYKKPTDEELQKKYSDLGYGPISAEYARTLYNQGVETGPTKGVTQVNTEKPVTPQKVDLSPRIKGIQRQLQISETGSMDPSTIKAIIDKIKGVSSKENVTTTPTPKPEPETITQQNTSVESSLEDTING